MRTEMMTALLVAVAALPPATVRAGEAPSNKDGAAPTRPLPPGQPATGFGGADYPHATWRVETLGRGGEQVRVFTPDGPAPAKPVPLVVFLHGWGAMEPQPYGAWIAHLVRRGNVVLYPRYQESFLTLHHLFTPAMNASVRAAMKHLEKEGATNVDRNRVAVVGHSMGGVLAVQYAALAAGEKLPVPKAVFVLEPGSAEQWNPRLVFPLADLSKIPQETLLLMSAGDRDGFVGEAMAQKLWGKLGHIPAANRDYLVFRSDAHGRPALVADHFFPLAPDGSILRPAPAKEGGERKPPGGDGNSSAGGRPMNAARGGIDALDWRGAWRLFDALMHAAFTGKGRDQCLGGTAVQKDMGAWSDGTPVAPMRVTDEPGGR